MSKTPLRLLLIEDNEDDAHLVLRQLSRGGFAVTARVVDSAAETHEALAQNEWQLVLSDYNMPGFSGTDALEIVRERDPDLPFIFVSGTIGEDIAVEAMRRGAQDYVMKGNLKRLVPAVERELREHATRQAEKRAQAERRATESRFRNVLTMAADAIITCNARQRILIFNQGAERIFGYRAEEIVGQPLERLIPKRFRRGHRRHLEAYASGAPASRTLMNAHRNTYAVRKDGTEFPIEASVARWDEIEGPTFTTILRDITERKRVEDEMRLLQTLSLAIGEAQDTYSALEVTLAQVCKRTGWLLGQAWLPSPQGMLECSPAWYCGGRGLEAFRAASLETRFEYGEGLPGRVWSSGNPLWLRDVASTGYFRRARAAQEVNIHAAIAIPVLAAGKVVAVLEFFYNEPREEDAGHLQSLAGIASQLGNAIQRKRAEERVHHIAQHDLLTGLPNRLLFEDRLNLAMAETKRHKHQLAILFVDLDRFKTVNESLSHEAGDALLMETSRRLRECIDEGDTLARLSADEFALLLFGVSSFEQTLTVTQQILDAVRRPFQWKEHELFTTASIGIALYPNKAATATELIRSADIALYRAKEAGGNGYQFHQREMTERAEARRALDSALHHALSAGEFELYYQPQVDLAAGNIVGVEALLRWVHPQRGLVGPDHFIPMAESSGLILPIGEWVLRTACRQLRAWQDAGLPPLRMSVNVSAQQFRQQDLVKLVDELLREYRLEPQSLELEITESILIQNGTDTAQVLGALRHIGVEIALDDFGTGYSSLSYLKRFPVSCLKIDKSFVKDTPGDHEDTAITRTIIDMAHHLSMKVVAEGIETAEQLAFLTTEGCELGQGYFLQRPAAAARIQQLLQANEGRLPGRKD